MAIVTGSDSKLAIEERLRVIDQQKAELFELIQQLNSKRNELAPVSVLPPELLGRVFNFVIAESITDNRYAFPSPSHFASSFNFTYVSQTWRNVALDTPGLWDTPAFVYPTWARVMLERSKMADLVVNSDISMIANPTVITEVFDNHAARIREIDLRGLDSSLFSSIVANVQPSSLRLRSLSFSGYRADWMEAHNPEHPVFPAHLLVQPDCLRRLVLTLCAFDLYAQPRPMLTHLSVTRPLDRPLLSEFVTALSGMPALETLQMVHSLPLATKTVKLDLKVELPRLSFLELVSTQSVFEVLNVVDFLIVPCTARVDLFCTGSSIDAAIQPSDIVPPLDLFFSCMTGNVEERFHNRLDLRSIVDGLGLSLSNWRIEQADIPTSCPDLNVTLGGGVFQSDDFVFEILSCLPLLDLEMLVIDIGIGQDVINSYFGQSNTIQTVELQDNVDISEFLKVLTHKPEGYDRLESSYYSVSFPSLQTLKFNRATFHTFGKLLDCLMERYERGAELQKLVIRVCYDIDEEDIQLLREIVPDVEWDGVVETYGDGDDSCDSYPNMLHPDDVIDYDYDVNEWD